MLGLIPSLHIQISSTAVFQVSAEGSPESLELLASLTFMNTSVDCVPQGLHPAIPALGTLLLLGCVLLNDMTFWVFCFCIKQWDSGMILQVSLVLGDVLIIPVAPLRISYLSLGNQWPFGQFLCQLEFFLDNIHIYSSIYFLTLICIHRYCVVVRYKSNSLWKKKSFLRKLCLFIWLVLIVQGLPFFFVLKTSDIDGSAKCLNIRQSESSSIYYFYSMVVVVLSLLLPFATSLTCGALLGAAIAKVAKKSSRGKKMKSRSLQMITVPLVIFAICFGPLHVCRTIGVIVKYYGMSCKLLHQVEVACYVSWVFTMANTCLDPLIYVFDNEKFKRSFADSFHKCWGIKVTMKGPGATTDLPRESHGVATEDPDLKLPPPSVLSQVPRATNSSAAGVSVSLCSSSVIEGLLLQAGTPQAVRKLQLGTAPTSTCQWLDLPNVGFFTLLMWPNPMECKGEEGEFTSKVINH